MLTFDSVKNRLDREQSLSFLEFNYMIFQAYDFLILNEKQKVELQIGGSDQWGNIVNGVDLVKKVNNKEVYGLTTPLILNSSGLKWEKLVREQFGWTRIYYQVMIIGNFGEIQTIKM